MHALRTFTVGPHPRSRIYRIAKSIAEQQLIGQKKPQFCLGKLGPSKDSRIRQSYMQYFGSLDPTIPATHGPVCIPTRSFKTCNGASVSLMAATLCIKSSAVSAISVACRFSFRFGSPLTSYKISLYSVLVFWESHTGIR